MLEFRVAWIPHQLTTKFSSIRAPPS